MDSRRTRGVKRNRRWCASQKVRKRVEEIFVWMKTTGNFRKTHYRGVGCTHAAAHYVAAACNPHGKIDDHRAAKSGRGVTPRAATVCPHTVIKPSKARETPKRRRQCFSSLIMFRKI
jgi:hypothetical protein